MILTVGAVALLGASGLSAQTRATAYVPFEFTVQNTTLPAGEYTMSAASGSHDVIVVRNAEAKKAILVLAPSNLSEYKGSQKNVLVFRQIGDRYFLSEVKTDAVRGHIPPSKLEREIASTGRGELVAAVIVPALSVR